MTLTNNEWKEIPSALGLCLTTEVDHLGEAQSSTVYLWQFVCDIQHPSLWQMTFWLCTSELMHTLLQNLDWQIVTITVQTLGCWRSSNYNQVESCKQLRDASHNADCSWGFVQIYYCHLNTLQRLPHQCNTVVRPFQYACVSSLSEDFG